MDLSIFKLYELKYIAFQFKVDDYKTMDRQRLETVLKRRFPDVFKKRKLPKRAIKTLPKGTKLYHSRYMIGSSTDYDSKKIKFDLGKCRPCWMARTETEARKYGTVFHTDDVVYEFETTKPLKLWNTSSRVGYKEYVKFADLLRKKGYKNDPSFIKNKSNVFCTPGLDFENDIFSAFACSLFNVDGYLFDGFICEKDSDDEGWLPHTKTHEIMICNGKWLKKTNTIGDDSEPTFTKKYLGIDLGF